MVMLSSFETWLVGRPLKVVGYSLLTADRRQPDEPELDCRTVQPDRVQTLLDSHGLGLADLLSKYGEKIRAT